MSGLEVILVDEHDNQIGTMEKMEAHRQGRLHRAFSIFIYNSRGEMLLQQRAMGKYHSGGLWTNACCSHPQPGDELLNSALRRLGEELGFTTPISKVFDFVYRAGFENGLIEHEFDHVFTGTYDGPVKINEEEVSEYAFQPIDSIAASLKEEPSIYTEWFRIAFPMIHRT